MRLRCGRTHPTHCVSGLSLLGGRAGHQHSPHHNFWVLFGKIIKHVRHLMKLSVMTALPPKLPPTSLTLLCLLSVLQLLFGLDSPPAPAPASAAHPAKGRAGGQGSRKSGPLPASWVFTTCYRCWKHFTQSNFLKPPSFPQEVGTLEIPLCGGGEHVTEQGSHLFR